MATISRKLATAALTGLLAVGGLTACEGWKHGTNASNSCKGAHGCKGGNSCKDKNACKGANSCKDTNSCKGGNGCNK